MCSECQDRVSSLDRYHATLKAALRDLESEVHATSDGLIHGWVTQLPDGRYGAHHRGPVMDGGWEFSTKAQAWKYLRRSFGEMYPEHRCSRRCTRRNRSKSKTEKG